MISKSSVGVRPLRRMLLTSVLFSAFASSASSAVLLSTFDRVVAGSAGLGVASGSGFGTSRGLAFTTDSSPYHLDSIEVLGFEAEPGEPVGRLYLASPSGLPSGAPIGAFTVSSTPGGGEDVIPIAFTPQGTIVLQANTSYAFTLDTAEGFWALAALRLTSGFDRPDGGSWEFSDVALWKLYNEGVDPDTVAWSDLNPLIADPANHLRLHGRISATAIPEPEAALLLAVGVLTGLRRRRNLVRA